jgi:23S rRNA pseudouridine2457 synthase
MITERLHKMAPPYHYIVFYKPFGVLSAFRDMEGHSTLKSFIDVPGVYPAGRLDLDSEGLLFLSNDGPLMHALTDPDFEHPKTYFVQVEGLVTREDLARLESGIEIKGRLTRRCQAMLVPEPDLPDRLKPITPHSPTSWLRIVLKEGKKRQIRHMTAAVGHPTLRLVRVAVGFLGLDGLQPGEWRDLTPDEVDRLRSSLMAGRKRRTIRDGQTPEASKGSARESRYRTGGRQSSTRESHPSGAGDPEQK